MYQFTIFVDPSQQFSKSLTVHNVKTMIKSFIYLVHAQIWPLNLHEFPHTFIEMTLIPWALM